MSGAEAILGVVSAGAGLVSLGIQLGESAMKLKRIYHAARDAPTIIQMLLLDLETMALALGQLDQHRQHDNHGEELLVRCIARCQQCTQEVRLLVDKLERSLEKHFRLPGRLYSAFKERDVKDLLDDLERAKASLHIAYTMYMHAEQQRRDREHQALLVGLREQVLEGSATISQQLSVLVGSSIQLMQLEQPLSDITMTDSGDSSHRRGQNDGRAMSSTGMTRQKGNKSYFRTSFRFPSWLSSRIWIVALLRAQGGWTFEIRTWNIVPTTSLVVQYCERGNLAGIQRLMGSGQASPLDAIYSTAYGSVQRPRSLLEVAACEEHIEICRFLLSSMRFPDNETVLSNTLDICAACSSAFSVDPEEIYELFIKDPKFHPDLVDLALSGELPAWLTNFPTRNCLNIVLNHQGFDFLGIPANVRLDIALTMCPDEPEDFLRFIDPQQRDNSLAYLKSVDGESILHHVASHLNNSTHMDFAWYHFGVDLLRNGADPHALSSRRKFRYGFAYTPLIHLILYELSSLPAGLVRIIRKWAWMIHQAGLDLLEYGTKESEVWESLGVGTHSQHVDGLKRGREGICIKRLIFGPNPHDWSVEFAHSIVIELRRLHPLPGAYPCRAGIPDSIFWDPSEEEQDQGAWEFISTRTLLSPVVYMRDIGVPPEKPFLNLVNSTTQDDHGVIPLMQHRSGRLKSRALTSRSRAASQPPPLRKRAVMAPHATKWFTEVRPWLGDVHLCPFDLRWNFGHQSDWGDIAFGPSYSILADSRKCMQGLSCGHISVQQLPSWEESSFLSCIRDCQDRRECHRRWIHLVSQWDYEKGHTGTADCPWGCSKVHLDRLHVPESFKKWHPQRNYPHIDDDD